MSDLMTKRPSIRARSGFTAIELMVVISVIIILMGMAIPSLMGALRKGRVGDAANSIMRASSQARQLARTRAAAAKFYGLIIVNDEVPAYVAVTYGTSSPPTKGEILKRSDDNTKPLIKYPFNRNVLVYRESDQPVNGSVGWLYQYRTAYPIKEALPTSKTIDIGVNTNDVDYPFYLESLSLRTLDGKYKTGIAIYRIGLANAQDY